ncbi:transaldolase family protein [Streptomyces griseorubiginosus]|uniref:transaldolase family protein n=1 Tax=Streptomyces griseorubiginosus TaxID=67304 RepID=UPI0036E70A36
MSTVLEEIQRLSPTAEIWWDSSPLDFNRWRDGFLAGAPDRPARERWDRQLRTFLCPDAPDVSLVRGVTTNPSLVAQSVLATPRPWEAWIDQAVREQPLPDLDHTFHLVYEEALRRAARAMRPMWDATRGRYGWVSGQLDPRLMFNAEAMTEQGLRIAQIAPNLMVKVPGSAAGYQTIRSLVGHGISINNTLSYTVPQFLACVDAVEGGLRDAKRRGVDTTRWRAVFTHMIGRFGANADLRHEAAARGVELTATDLRWGELAVLKRIHRLIAEHDHPIKPLLSSLEADDRTQGFDGLSMHLEHSAGGSVAYTCKPQFVADVVRREAELPRLDAGGIDSCVPEHIMDKLMWLPSFQRGYLSDGMSSDQFAHYGAFTATYAEVLGNTRRLLDFVARRFQALSSRARPLSLSGSPR